MTRYLVTTAVEETWPPVDFPVLFLGEWCRIYDRKFSWEGRDAILANYHWDDRDKLGQDYLELRSLYEDLLKELATKLNELHSVDYSIRYWRIFVGPWLGYFVQILFDRWTMLQLAIKEYDISGVKVIRSSDDHLVPNDLNEFTSLIVNDSWNESLYRQILDWMRVPLDSVDIKTKVILKNNQKKGHLNQLNLSFRRILNQIFGLLCRDDEYFFITSYLGKKQELLLQLKLGQLPKSWQTVAPPVVKFDPRLRQWTLPQSEGGNEFFHLARTLIPKNIPRIFIEGYKPLISLVGHLPWPKKPKAIFTSNSLYTDDVFMAWAANKSELGVPLIVGQHGGNYGMAQMSFSEEHEIAVADQFISWGWSSSENDNVVPIGNLKGFGKMNTPKNTGIALLVEVALPRQSYYMWSAPVGAGQWLEYFDEQCRFVKSLSPELRDQLLVRLYPQDLGQFQKIRWKDRFPDIKLDDATQPIADHINKARIYISSYNATTYLESLALNVPTIIFWNPRHWELRESAKPHFERLKSVGIFHETPEDAAKHMIKVWGDVCGWWQSADVQSARKDFCGQYVHTPEKPLVLMEGFFKSIADGKQTVDSNFAACSKRGQ